MDRITKSNFMLYLQCKKAFWLYKNKPREYPKEEVNLFKEKLKKEGYEVEEYAKKLFKNGISITEGDDAIEETKKAMEASEVVLFQPSFITEEGFFYTL